MKVPEVELGLDPPGIATALSRLGQGGRSFGEMLDELGPQAPGLVALVLALPFLTPVPLPGVSTPFGLAIAVAGWCIAHAQDVHLPGWVARRSLPDGLMRRAMTAAALPLGWLERRACPRWQQAIDPMPMRLAAGLTIALSGALLALPIPIPGTNAAPAGTILLVAGGRLLRDGVLVSCGLLAMAGTLVFFAALAWGVWYGGSILFQ